MKKMNKTLLILIFVMLISTLGYGIVIPLLYPYASRFGIKPFGLSLLFASFSLAQFISTPILGRLSDRFGRKWILLICLVGTSASLALWAVAKSAAVLFIARAIDGITGGNISVAQAVIADTTEGEERVKAFGLLGATFGFGFLFGPAIGGLLSQISLSAPFWFASSVGLVGAILGVFLLEETLPKGERQASNKPLFPIKSLALAVFSPLTGIVLFISLLAAIGQNSWVIGFQSFTVDVLKLSARDIGILFTIAGLISMFMQAVGVRWLIQTFKSKEKILTGSMIISAFVLVLFLFVNTFLPFAIVTILYMFTFSAQMAMVPALISERTKAEDQGGIMGINQAYLSLGQIIGPLIAGAVASVNIHWVFGVTLILVTIASFATRWLVAPSGTKIDL
jgi:multidrug resistance protein